MTRKELEALIGDRKVTPSIRKKSKAAKPVPSARKRGKRKKERAKDGRHR